ncbi:MAG: S46 family peptidase, partial [Sphingomonadaceae bacterium]
PERAARLRPVIDSLDRVAAEEAEADLTGATAGLLNRAQLLAAARTLYRWAKEREKPDAEREFGFQDRDRRLIAERLTAIERRYDPRVDRGLFEQALGEYARLPEKDRSKALAAALADGGLDRLYAGTRLGDTAERLAWMDRPASAFETSDDPFIRLAVAMYPEDIAAENARKDRQGRMQQARSAYLAAWREWAASRGEATYPDANGSLRFTFGKVTGKARDGMRWDAFTTDLGILEKATGREPFDAPERQLAALRNQARFAGLARPDGRLPVNYLSTVDITNGNSGSATLNARGELVGLAFDGTIEGVISDWWFDDALTRTIHVDSRYMVWTMEQDGAQRLLAEMEVAR